MLPSLSMPLLHEATIGLEDVQTPLMLLHMLLSWKGFLLPLLLVLDGFYMFIKMLRLDV